MQYRHPCVECIGPRDSSPREALMPPVYQRIDFARSRQIDQRPPGASLAGARTAPGTRGCTGAGTESDCYPSRGLGPLPVSFPDRCRYEDPGRRRRPSSRLQGRAVSQYSQKPFTTRIGMSFVLGGSRDRLQAVRFAVAASVLPAAATMCESAQNGGKTKLNLLLCCTNSSPPTELI